MTRKTNSNLIWIGLFALLMLPLTYGIGVGISFTAGPREIWKEYFILGLVLIELLSIFFCLFLYGCFARFATWAFSNLNSADRRSSPTIHSMISFFKFFGVWVESVKNSSVPAKRS